eukprot:9326017-Pyramimonas_sp.AAC.1
MLRPRKLLESPRARAPFPFTCILWGFQAQSLGGFQMHVRCDHPGPCCVERSDGATEITAAQTRSKRGDGSRAKAPQGRRENKKGPVARKRGQCQSSGQPASDSGRGDGGQRRRRRRRRS